MLYIITREGCPYCEEAKKNIVKLRHEQKRFCMIPITMLPESENVMQQYDYYYAPAYFWDKDKLAEGIFAEEDLCDLFQRVHSMSRGSAE